jgi:hypothetical protein
MPEKAPALHPKTPYIIIYTCWEPVDAAPERKMGAAQNRPYTGTRTFRTAGNSPETEKIRSFEMFRPGGNRAIAAAQSLLEVIILLGVLGYPVHFSLGSFPLDLFQLTVTLLDVAIAAMLLRRAWKAWKESSSLRAEFEAAREVQRQLVTAPPATPGFRIEAEYRPAT